MEFGDKVFVIRNDEVQVAVIHHPISHRGVVTGYRLRGHSDSEAVKVSRKYVFVDEDDAKKALFKKKLKADETIVTPAEDKVGDRHWIAGHRRNGYGR